MIISIITKWLVEKEKENIYIYKGFLLQQHNFIVWEKNFAPTTQIKSFNQSPSTQSSPLESTQNWM